MSARLLRLTPASAIKPERVRWLLPGLVPLGKLTVLAGAPGLGKSMWTTNLAALVSTGATPGDLLHQCAPVFIGSAEDDPADTIIPRLMAAGADLELVSMLDMRTLLDDGTAIPGLVQVPGDVAAIEADAGDLGAKLLILDPVVAFLDGDHSAYREQEVRAALHPLQGLAERTGAAVIAVMHLNKSEGTDPLRRIANSGAFTGAARSVLLFGRDPEDPAGDDGRGRVLVNGKLNVGPDGHGVRLRIENATIAGDGEDIPTAKIVTVGQSTATPETLLSTREDRGALGDAVTWLRDYLADGPKLSKDVRAAAEEQGHAFRTLKRAKAQASVQAVKDGIGAWTWTLPDTDTSVGPLQDDSALTVGPLGPLWPPSDGHAESKVADVGPLPSPLGPLGPLQREGGQGGQGGQGNGDPAPFDPDAELDRLRSKGIYPGDEAAP